MDKDRFFTLLTMEGMEDLIEWLELEARALEDRLIRYDLIAGSPEGLAYDKCRLEGFRKALDGIRLKVKKTKEKRVASLTALAKHDV